MAVTPSPQSSLKAESFIDKIPPQNLEAETSLLGSLILDNQQIGEVLELVAAESFYKPAHQLIFKLMVDLYDNRKPIDLVILHEELDKKGILDEAGGTEYLTTLVSSVPSASNAQYYAKIIKEKSVLRSLLSTCSNIIREANESTADSEQLLDTAEKLIFEVTKRRTVTASISIKDILRSAFDKLTSEDRFVSGIETGLTDLDNQTGGLHPSQLVIIAGRPSMGKTSFALKIIHHAAVHMQKPVLFFSFEMDCEMIALNMVCSEAKISSFNVRKGTYDKNEGHSRLLNAAAKMSEAPIYIDDTPGLSIFELRARARRLKAEKDIQLIVVDYLQLMEYRARGVDNRQQEIATLSRGFKSLARELNVPVIVLSQLNRAVETRDTNRPRMSDLRESGAIEQDADIVMLLYREDYYKPETPKKNITEIIIAKQRNGPVGTVEAAFIKDYMRFENLSKAEEFVPIMPDETLM
ncbi:MAG: replicative DNA helicase [Planctomycetes bacterium]|nr:replicative DNA helicase [Planctomycetota bacterium]